MSHLSGYSMAAACALFGFAGVSLAQTTPGANAAGLDLRQRVAQIAADAQGRVAVACSLPGTKLNCDLEPHAHPPMQSVFKLPLAMAILHRVEQGSLSMDQPIRFLASDRILPHAYSPLQDRYPEANVDVPLRELLSLAVSLSDNAAADILLRLLGGPAALDQYMASIGITGFHAEHTENQLHHDVKAQYEDWFEPAAAVQLLNRIGRRSPLSLGHTALLLGWMSSGRTIRIKRDLPAGTVVAHKSGTSDVEHGVAYATNDIGLITLPDGRRLAIAIFVSDSKAEEAAREGVIARISLAAYDAAVKVP